MCPPHPVPLFGPPPTPPSRNAAFCKDEYDGLTRGDRGDEGHSLNSCLHKDEYEYNRLARGDRGDGGTR